MRQRILPPGRTSASSMKVVQPVGCMVWRKCSRVVHTRHTSERGASNSREITIAFSPAMLAVFTSSSIGLLQGGNIELVHLQHCLHHALFPGGVFVPEHARQRRGGDLPGDPELVLEPAAVAG